MNSSWKEQKLSEFADVIMGQSPKSEYYNHDKIGAPFLQGNRTFGTLYPIYDTWCSNPIKIAKKNSVLMSVRAPVGDMNIAPSDLCIGRGLSSLSMKNSNNQFLFYLLKANQKKILSNESGTVFGSVNKNTIENIKLLVTANENEQIRIANILSSLDDKIELNNKINQNLETLAQILYKHWFVDFEFPNENGESYKSSGGEMVESELGFVPKGWSIVALKDLIDVIDNRGKTPPLVSSKSDYPIIDVKALSGKGAIIDYDNCMKFVSKEVYDNWFRSGHPKHKDVLISTVGSLAEMKLFLRNKGAIAQNVVAFRSVAVDAYYLYYYLQNIKKDLISYNIGSVQPSIKVTHIIKHLLLLPNKTLMDTFSKLIESNITKTSHLHQESKILKMIRDTLLPKLMNGEIEVPV